MSKTSPILFKIMNLELLDFEKSEYIQESWTQETKRALHCANASVWFQAEPLSLESSVLHIN